MPDTTYKPVNVRFESKGIIARNTPDTAPPNTFLALTGCEERQENALSSRLGSLIITRDPNGTPGGQNYPLVAHPIALARLAYNGNFYRYAGDSSGNLYRRTGNAQGPYTNVLSGLSGNRFSTAVNTCFSGGQSYLFIADDNLMLKDMGVGTPSKWGISPPLYAANISPQGPNILLIDGFANGESYTLGNATLGYSAPTSWAFGSFGASFTASLSAITSNVATVTAANGFTAGESVLIQGSTNAGFADLNGESFSIVSASPTQFTFNVTHADVISDSDPTLTATLLTVATVNVSAMSAVNNFQQYVSDSTSLLAFNGALAENGATLSAIFNVYGEPYAYQFSAIGIGGSLSLAPFILSAWTGSVPTNTTVSVAQTVALDLSQNNQVTDDDLIVLTLQVSDPSAIEEIQLQFDINNSGYTTSYYYKSISPQYYQAANSSDSFNAVESQVFALAAGFISGTQVPASSLQPASTSTGANAWTTIYIRRGDFVPVGTAGSSGFEWGSVTGWQITVQTNTNGAATFACNGLYLQWSQGPSSYGGNGYDYRYTYWNQNTFTESNGSQENRNDVVYGASVASSGPLIVLRQPIWVAGQYSSNPQTTHVRAYRRGGQWNDGWKMVNQFPNITGGGFFSWLDTIPDMYMEQATPLRLDNDVPITSTLPVPIITTLAAPTIAPAPTNGINTPYDVFVPQTITATTAANFVVGQTVDIGNPYNLEQVRVITGGVGSFTGIVRLTHAAGEPVYVYSIPEQSCDIVAVASNGQMYMAGDKNNPNWLYYTNEGYPENCGPENHIPAGPPDDPITIVANYRGNIMVATTRTWYQLVQGQIPYLAPTGSVHGCVAKHGWCLVEGALWYQAIDGLREFRGADGAYISLPIEWIFTNNPATPIALADLTQLSNTVMTMRNSTVYVVYAGTDGNNHRLIYDLNYRRFRNDDVACSTIFLEEDTNLLLYGTQGGLIVQDRYGDYDDGGWVAGVLTQTPITMAPQLPYQDLGAPHNPKQWNTVEIDANTQGQPLTVLLATDNNVDLNIGTVSSTSRQKLQLPVNAGDGIEAYRLSLKLNMSVTVAPELYQADIYAAVLPPYRTSFDTFWIKMDTDESKMCKFGFFDYTAAQPITFQLFKDMEVTPYFTFTLPMAVVRAGGPIQQKFPACTFRLWRIIATSTGDFRLWQTPKIKWKKCTVGQSWADLNLPV